MRLDEIAPHLLLEMAYTRQRASQIITGLEMPINLHLLKLVAVPRPEEFAHWRLELATWLITIAVIRLKPSTEPGSASFYSKLLYEEPFGGNEMHAVTARLQLLRQQYNSLRPGIDPQQLANKLRDFHDAFAKGCSAGTLDLIAINGLLDAYAAGSFIVAFPADRHLEAGGCAMAASAVLPGDL